MNIPNINNGSFRRMLSGLSGALVLCCSGRVAAQCPAGFLDLGEVSAEVNPGRYKELSVTKELLLPKAIRIDESYRQKSIQAASDGGASNLRVVDIPAGFHLIPEGGRPGGGWWSIDNPKLEPASVDEKHDVSLWKFKIDLYANSGGRTPLPPAASGRGPAASTAPNVRVRVCIKVER